MRARQKFINSDVQHLGNSALPLAQESVVSKFHTPRVGIVITHFNYAECIGDALLSVQQQTHANFTCVIVDDHSDEPQYDAVRREVAGLADDRFKLVRNAENLGQTPSFYRGLDEIDAAFVAVLDPDDRYVPEFIARMLAVHLNPRVFCPLVSCEQFLLKLGDGIITKTHYANGSRHLEGTAIRREQETFSEFGFHRFISPAENGSYGATTSSMFFRTDALKLIKPNRKLGYKRAVDAYLGNGAHMMGGTIVLREPLVYRGLHSNNSYISQFIFSMFQNRQGPRAKYVTDEVRRDVIEAFVQNGGLDYFSPSNFRDVILSQFQGEELAKLLAAVPRVAEVLEA